MIMGRPRKAALEKPARNPISAASALNLRRPRESSSCTSQQHTNDMPRVPRIYGPCARSSGEHSAVELNTRHGMEILNTN